MYSSNKVLAFYTKEESRETYEYERARFNGEPLKGVKRYYEWTELWALLCGGEKLYLGRDLKTPKTTKIGKYFVPDVSRLEVIYSDGEVTYIEHLGLVEGDFTPKGEY